MRIAIFGGSFNPPHLGHMRVVRAAIDNLRPDLFLIIPDNLPPHKQLSENAPSARERLELCKVAFSPFPEVQVSDIELQRGGKSYTCDTLAQLKNQYPEAELYLVIGRDMFDSFQTWKNPDEIQKMCALYVAPREPLSESSTLAREQLASEGFSPLLSGEVNDFISKNHFYSRVREDNSP